MKNNKIKIGIAGLGTVGSGVINLLNNNKDEILKRTGCEFLVQCVSARNKDKARSCDINNINFYTDPVDMLENEKIDIFVELIGGDDIAKNIVTRAIEKKNSYCDCKQSFDCSSWHKNKSAIFREKL